MMGVIEMEEKGMSADEIERIKGQMNRCAVAIAQTMFEHSDSAKASLLAVTMVAAGGARALGVNKHAAIEMFLSFYNDATNFMNEE
jgi:hypothetical protein